MAILGWIVFGVAVGMVARFVLPGHLPLGSITLAFIGLVGTIGVLLGLAQGWYAEGEAVGFLVPVAGAVVLAPIQRALRRRPRPVFRS
jgi:uncharacterized membrane protein YeaQ/YmgE (transglycosylase-associated protein family)